MVMGITETYYNSNVQTLTDSRYFDIYVDINNSQLWNRRILGDATGEAGPFILFSSAPQYKSSMHGEVANFIYSGYYFFYRGSFESAGHLAGVFAFGRGQNGESASFRITLAVK